MELQFAKLKQEAGDSEKTIHARFSLDGSSFLLIATPMERLHAHVLNVVSLEGALNNVSKAQGQIIAANIVLIFLLSIITYYLNSIILKSLRRLTETMKRVRKGEVTAAITIQGAARLVNWRIILTN